MSEGYAGKVLFVDLTKGSIKTDKFSAEDCRRFIGGSGLGAKHLKAVAVQGKKKIEIAEPERLKMGIKQ